MASRQYEERRRAIKRTDSIAPAVLGILVLLAVLFVGGVWFGNSRQAERAPLAAAGKPSASPQPDEEKVLKFLVDAEVKKQFDRGTVLTPDQEQMLYRLLRPRAKLALKMGKRIGAVAATNDFSREVAESAFVYAIVVAQGRLDLSDISDSDIIEVLEAHRRRLGG